jgi:ferredoxin-NADP reductase
VTVWQPASLVGKRPETATATTLDFDVDGWPGHQAGQHVDVKLTAGDGYSAERSYSIASPPGEAPLALTIERLEDGEVSRYLVDAMEPGDRLELRGPIGGWFVWSSGDGGPLLLIGGGSGVVPLMAMLRHHANTKSTAPVRMLVSARTLDDLIYADELARIGGTEAVEVYRTLTRRAPPGWEGFTRRVDREMLDAVAWPPGELRRTYICGPTAFVEAAADALVALGHDPALIRTERFGPTGT